MVRLKVCPLRSGFTPGMSFQFHYGSIKSGNVYKCVDGVTVFQFHYGSIKRDGTVLKAIAVLEFQFHYGSIKSHLSPETTPAVHHFNSTMVRLKGVYL